VLQDISTGFGLRRRHCTKLSEYALKSGYPALAVEWVQAAQRLISDESPGSPALEKEEKEISALIQDAILNVRRMAESLIIIICLIIALPARRKIR